MNVDIVEQLRECAGDYSLFDKDVGREAADELTRLRADLALVQGQRDEAVQKMQAGWVEVCDTAVLARNRELEAEVKRLRDENAGLRKDAARYRWLRNHADAADWEMFGYQDVDKTDAAIDAAMQKGE